MLVGQILAVVFVVIAALSFRFTPAVFPTFDVVSVVVVSTGSDAGPAPNSCYEAKEILK